MCVTSKCMVVLAAIGIACASPVFVDFCRDDVTAQLDVVAAPRKPYPLSQFPSLQKLRLGQTSTWRAVNPSPVFDPVLVYSTLFGGFGGVSTNASVALVDGAGDVFIGGSGNVSTTPGASLCPSCITEGEGAFLSKIDPTGQSLVFSTYFVGPSATALAVDSFGNIYVGGLVGPRSVQDPSSPAILPIPPGTTPFQASPKGLNIGILKLNSTATKLLAATYLGGSGLEDIGGLAVDSDNNVCIVGTTTSNDFPVSHGALQTSLGTSGQNVFFTKLDANLSSAVYSTYLGQNSSASVGNPANASVGQSFQGMPAGHSSLAVDALKNVYIAGNAGAGFPTTSTGIQPTCAGRCPFVAKLNPTGTSLLYSTYLAGGSVYALAVDSSQNIYVGGPTGAGFPTTANALQSCNAASGDFQAFISEINAAGALTFSTCLGAEGAGGITDIVADSAQNLHVIGYGALPLINPIQSTGGPFIASISPNSNPPSLLFSSYIGSGLPNDSLELRVASVGTDSSGNLYVVGSVGGTGFPVFNALQPIAPNNPSGGIVAAFLWKIGPTDAPAAAVEPGALSFPSQQVGVPSTPQSLNVFDLGSAPLTISNVTTTGDFSVQNNCTTTVAAAGGTCTLVVTYTPSGGVGMSNGKLTIMDNSAGSPHTIQLTGQSAEPTLTVAPTSLAFGNVNIGSTGLVQTVTLSNPGPLNVPIMHVDITGDFAESNSCGTSLTAPPTPAQPNTCSILVTFTPTAQGSRSGTLTITDGTSDSPQTIALSGTGGNPTLGLTIAAGSPSSATAAAGANATYVLSIGGNGMSGTASLTCTGAPAAATCTVPATTSISATAASTFKAMVTTTARTQTALHPGAFWDATWAWAFAMIGCVFLAKLPPQRSRIGYLGLLALFALAFSSCGGGSSKSPQSGGTIVGTPAGTFNLVVTATSGGTTQTQNLTLIVQ